MDPSRLLTINDDKGVFRLRGTLADFSELEDLLVVPPPLRLDLSGLTGLNSMSIGQWVRFIGRWGDRPFELHGCPPEFVDLINLIPAALGKNPQPGCVKSILVPYMCEACGADHNFLVKMSDLVIDGEDVKVPENSCPACKHACRMAVDAGDYFLFLISPV
jgi:hypothetical protein